jgi:hypothetical protein
MKATVILLLLLLGAGAARAQQAPPQLKWYKGSKLRPVGTDSGRVGLGRPGNRTGAPAAGNYRTEPYALRVQVPSPHRDSAAVVTPANGYRRGVRPLPPVRLVPESPNRPRQ